MNKTLGAQISHMLKDRGVEVIFGIPGVHNQEMYRGIEEAGLTHVLARHEQGAGFMADGYARATGKPGVAYVISGPGLCNIMTPMGQAYSDSVPMLVISSCLEMAEKGLGRGRLHEMKDQEGAANTVCDWSFVAQSPTHAYELIDRALREFFAGRSRSKHVQVPISLLEALAPEHPTPPQTGEARKCPDPQNIIYAADALRTARKPLIIFGGGARDLAATAAGQDTSYVTRLLSQLPAATFSTYAGRGIVPRDYPLDFGSMLARPDSAAIAAESDCVLVIGSHLSEVDLWRDQLGHACPMIRVDIDQDVLNGHGGPAFVIEADAASFVTSLLDAWGHAASQSEWSQSDVAAKTARWRAEIDAERPGILPVAEALRAALPADTMIYSDMTQFAYAAKEFWPMDRPGHWHHPSGFGTLGYALPAAIGGKIGVGAKPVVAIAGDYGFQYTLQELMVAVELELCLPIIIWDNGKLGEIEDSMVQAQIAPNAVVQSNPDFVKLAAAYGAAAARPGDLAALKRDVAAALAHKGPTIIHVQSDIALAVPARGGATSS